MFDSHKVWLVLWDRAAADPTPFEIDDITAEVARDLQIDAKEANRRVGMLLGELQRLPEGEQYFAREGNAVVPLPEFVASAKDEASALKVYPFEL
jgi:hypothetical protein